MVLNVLNSSSYLYMEIFENVFINKTLWLIKNVKFKKIGQFFNKILIFLLHVSTLPYLKSMEGSWKIILDNRSWIILFVAVKYLFVDLSWEDISCLSL